MTLTYKPVDAGHVPAHVRNAFAERCPSNPPSENKLGPEFGWQWQSRDEKLQYYWLRSSYERWCVATVKI